MLAVTAVQLDLVRQLARMYEADYDALCLSRRRAGRRRDVVESISESRAERVADALERLARLRYEGALTGEEFERLKREAM